MTFFFLIHYQLAEYLIIAMLISFLSSISLSIKQQHFWCQCSVMLSVKPQSRSTGVMCCQKPFANVEITEAFETWNKGKGKELTPGIKAGKNLMLGNFMVKMTC